MEVDSMSIKVSRYSGAKIAVGEVASIHGSEVIVYIYPHRYPEVSVGEVLLINSGDHYPIIIIDRNIHRARREQGFTPLMTGHDELKEIYPDADRLYIYAVSGITVGFSDKKGGVTIGIGPSPRLHDFAYIMDSNDRSDLFLADREADFTILRYLLHSRNDPILLREFLIKNRDVINGLGEEREVFKKFFKTLSSIMMNEYLFKIILTDFINVLGWDN